MATPVDCARVDDVTEEHLGGASRFELAAFQTACLELILDITVPEWTAICVIWDDGNWREVVAERCWLQWTIAQRLTAEEREGPAPHARLSPRLGPVRVESGAVSRPRRPMLCCPAPCQPSAPSVATSTRPTSSSSARRRGKPCVGEPTPPPPVQRPMRWEYKDLTIPLNLKFDHGVSDNGPEAQQAFNRIVLRGLQQVGQEGWQAEGPTDFKYLMKQQDAVTWRTEGHFYPGVRYLAVTIRLKRLVPG